MNMDYLILLLAETQLIRARVDGTLDDWPAEFGYARIYASDTPAKYLDKYAQLVSWWEYMDRRYTLEMSDLKPLRALSALGARVKVSGIDS